MMKSQSFNFLCYFRKIHLKPLIALISGNTYANIVYLLCFLILGFILKNEKFALFRVAYAYIMMTVGFSHMGLNVSLTKFFPSLTIAQKKTAMVFSLGVSMAASIIGGCVVWMYVPVQLPSMPWFEAALYMLSYPLAIYGATICNFALAIFQAEGKLLLYSRFQFRWRALLFSSATLGGLLGGALWALIFMSFSYILIFWNLRDALLDIVNLLFIKTKTDWSVTARLVRIAIWPLVATGISTFYANAEFLYIKAEDMATGIAGAYSLASLIFLGGSALFFPFQTYAISKLVRHEISLSGIWRLQFLCCSFVTFIAVLSIVGAYALNYVNATKFDAYFIEFAILVSLKLILWGMYSVTGSMLNYIGKEFESVLLTMLAFAVLLLVPSIFSLEANIELMVRMQLLTGLIVLLGSSLLFYIGFLDYSKMNVDKMLQD